MTTTTTTKGNGRTSTAKKSRQATKNRMAEALNEANAETVDQGKTVTTRAKSKTAKSKEEEIRILPQQISILELPIVGTSYLIQHFFGEKARKQIRDKQAGKAKQKERRDPQAEYIASFYMIKGKPEKKGCVYGIPANAFKEAMVGACRFIDGLPMTRARGAFFCWGTDHREMTTIVSKSGPRMVEDIVRLSGPGAPPDLRYRPYFDDWSTVVQLEYDPTVITAEQLVNLANKAGFAVGVQEWRPEKGGQYGRFKVDEKRLQIS